jgi:hypothetical protein
MAQPVRQWTVALKAARFSEDWLSSPCVVCVVCSSGRSYPAAFTSFTCAEPSSLVIQTT